MQESGLNQTGGDMSSKLKSILLFVGNAVLEGLVLGLILVIAMRLGFAGRAFTQKKAGNKPAFLGSEADVFIP